MPNAESKTVSVDDFLSDQAKEATVLLATIEPTPSGNDAVLVTPWRTDAGCLCTLAFTVPKSAIDHLVTTGDQHACCGKRQRVVEVHLKETHRPVAAAITEQVNRMPAQKSARVGAPLGPAQLTNGVACIRECAMGRKLCVQGCSHLPAAKRQACFEGCADTFGQCYDGCGFMD